MSNAWGNDPSREEIFVGREQELRDLLEHIRSGTHTLLVGEKGIGKSALIVRALGILTGAHPNIDLSRRVTDLESGRLRRASAPVPRVFTVTNISPFSECLREIGRQLWEAGLLALPEHLQVAEEWEAVRKWLVSLGRIGGVEAVKSSLEHTPERPIVVLDSLDRIGQAHQHFVEHLFACSTVVGAVSRPNESSHFARIWATFTPISLGPLRREKAQLLVERLIAAYGVRPTDRRLFTTEVLASAAGNPFHIRLSVWRLSRGEHLGPAEIRSLRRRGQGEYFNMGPIYIFGASIFTLYKILSIGMDNREFYIYFSSLGFFVYLTFRVFRNFFLFRPQRKH